MHVPSRSRTVRRSALLPCQVVRERDFRLVSTLTLDVAEGGLRVRADRPVLTGERMIVSMRVPFSPVWLDAEAVVARVAHGRRRGDRARSLGLTFTDVDRAALEAFTQQLGWFREVTPIARVERRRAARAPGSIAA